MKRYGNLYRKICSIENLRLAHHNAKKGKGWYREVKMVNADLEYYLLKLQDSLINKNYHTSEYETFLKTDGPKEREIYKLPYYPDRICQWAIMQVIEPYIIKTLTIDTYSAIPNRGIHFGLKRVLHDMRTDEEGCQYCLKLDVQKYYPSIDHSILKAKYRKLFKDKDLLWILDEIIDSTDGDVGIPIGNYLSQWSGNFYLSSFDHWIKEVKGVKHYHRYMDDIVIFGSNKADLQKLLGEVKMYFKDELNLTVKGNYQVFPTFIRGLDFLGYRYFKGYILLRKYTAKRLKAKMKKILKKITSGKLMSYSDWCSVNSYAGWLISCNGFRLYQKYIRPLMPYYIEYYQETIISKKGGLT